MKTKARNTRVSQKAAKRAPKSGVTAVDRNLLRQAAKEDAEGPASTDTLRSMKAAAPADVVREAKARIAAATARPLDEMSGTEANEQVAKFAKAQTELADMAVPMTLADIAAIVGVDCRVDQFAATALETLSGQVEALAAIAEKEEVRPYEAFRLLENVSGRMKLAARVTAWLESETPLASMPGVQP